MSDDRATLNKWHHLRGALLLLVLLAAFVGLGVRLYYLQVMEHERYRDIAARQQLMLRTVKAHRGVIIDRNRRVLCTSEPVDSVYLVPKDVERRYIPLVSVQLSRALGLDEAELRRRIERHHEKEFIWVKRRVSKEEAQAVRHVKGVGFRTEYRRQFPQGGMAAHVTGFTDVDGMGQEGLERRFDEELAGQDGYERLQCDGHRRPLLSDDAVLQPVVHGNSLQLTIDSRIQRMVCKELDRLVREHAPVSATIIVMEVQTGRILALENRPTFDPSNPADAEPRHRFNPAVAASYEPGSVFKPFVMAGFLEAKLASPHEQVFCENGLFRIRKRRLRDHHPYGWLSVMQIMEKSSNIGMAKIGLRMGTRKLHDTVRAFGFGEKTGIRLSGEVPGNVRNIHDWTYYTLTSVPMGHEIAATPIQLIAAFNAIANRGVLVRPQMVESITGPDGEIMYAFREPHVVRRVMSPETARLMVDPILRNVVLRGTGRRANIGVYSKFGKTGTAQKTSPGQGYSHSRFVSSFLCGAPVEHPLVTVLVIVDEPRRGSSYYGGVVAAPSAAKVVEETLRILNVPEGTVAQGQAL